jgi:acetylglutamate kinase
VTNSKPNTAALLARYPHLSQLAGQRYMVKYGGAAMEDISLREAVCRDIALLSQLGIEIVVVHGGGKEITRLLERLSIESRFIAGVRVTSPEAMAVTEMVLSGLVNKDLASRISRHGAPSLGISGRDAHIIEAVPYRNQAGDDFGETGDVSTCNQHPLVALLKAGFVPVVSPVGESAEGAPRNLNADIGAAAVAGAIGAIKAIFLTDVDGVRIAGSVQKILSPSQIDGYIQDGEITGGMIPKVECALRALRLGCRESVICNATKADVVVRAIIGDSEAGTVLAAAALSPPRP